MIKKNIVPAIQVETLKKLLAGRSKMPVCSIEIHAEMQEFQEKKDHAELFKLQYGIIVKDLQGNVLVTFREDQENGKARITSGYSIITSGSSYERAIEKLQNINFNSASLSNEEISINGMYVFIVRTYIIKKLPDSILLNGTDKNGKAMKIAEAMKKISDKSMEIALLDESQEEQNPEEKTKIKNPADLSKKDIQPK